MKTSFFGWNFKVFNLQTNSGYHPEMLTPMVPVLTNMPEQALNSFLLHGIEMLTILLVKAAMLNISTNGRLSGPAVCVYQNLKTCFPKHHNHEICRNLPEIWQVRVRKKVKVHCVLEHGSSTYPFNDTPLQKNSLIVSYNKQTDYSTVSCKVSKQNRSWSNTTQDYET